MPRNSRLSRADFKNMRGFKRLQGRFLSLSFGLIPGRSTPGAAIVVSSKAVGTAVKRNLLKRRARSILAKELHSTRGGMVYVVYAKKGSAAASFDEIKADILSLLARAGSSR